MSTLKTFSNCRYIASPFTSLGDLSWRLLLRKLGVHLCFTKVECLENVDCLFGNEARQDDQPLIVQVISKKCVNACYILLASMHIAHICHIPHVVVEHLTFLKNFGTNSPKSMGQMRSGLQSQQSTVNV